MKQRLLCCAFLVATVACQRERDVQPIAPTLADEVVGTYYTNVYLDPSSVATPADQLPYTELKRESADRVTLVYTRRFPDKEIREVPHVSLSRQGERIEFRLAGASVGALQADRIFTSSGMEKQDRLLRIALPDGSLATVSFAGLRQP